MEIKKRQLEIINAAGELLTQNGVNGFTIKNLAAKMGFVESAVYRHFSSKEEIIVKMLDYFIQNLQSLLDSGKSSSDDPEQQIRAIYKQQVAFFSKNPHFLIAVLSEGLFEENDVIKGSIQKVMTVTKEHLISIITHGQSSKKFSTSVPSGELVHIIMGSFRMLMLQWRMAGFSFDLEARGKQLTENILSLIKSR